MSSALTVLSGFGTATRQTQWDPHTPGFGVRTYPSGRQVYVAQARMNGRLRTVMLGPTSILSETEALRLARQVLWRAQGGDNPAQVRQEALAAPPFDVVLDVFWRLREPSWKLSTRRTNGVYRRRCLDGAFKNQFIDQITQAEVARWFAETTDRLGPGGANRGMSLLSTLFSKAEDWGYRRSGSNPCSSIRQNRRRVMERFLSKEELGRLGEILASQRTAYPVHVAAILVILFTGCRVSEILELKWQDVRGQRLHLRDSKTGPRTVWIGEEGRAVLDSLTRRRGIEMVFHDPKAHIRAIRLTYFWNRVRELAELPNVRMHDLRHTYASHAAAQSETLPMIARLLGHRRVKSTARYAHLDDRDVVRAAEVVGEAVEALLARKVK
jgi:integrase